MPVGYGYSGSSYYPQYAGGGLLDLLGMMNDSHLGKPPYTLNSQLFPEMNVSNAPEYTGGQFMGLLSNAAGKGGAAPQMAQFDPFTGDPGGVY